jgi:hypothetical protein
MLQEPQNFGDQQEVSMVPQTQAKPGDILSTSDRGFLQNMV